MSAAVPVAGLAKSNVSVSQALATVVVASVSTECVGSAASSTLRRTLMPALGEYTRTVMRVLAASNGILPTDLSGPVDTVVPANVSAVADLTTFATLLVPPAGSATTEESSAPPKPVNV